MNTTSSFQDGPALWRRAREVISCGTGLLSKRASMFGDGHWPSYFSRCEGCEVWDLSGRKYVDFAGGIGAVLLGYADPDVTIAVKARLDLGTYCTLVNPQEVELAERLLTLHPWAGKVRYARGGGEAMTMAVRIARAATGKSGVAFCGYHGWHDWYLAANLAGSHSLDGHLIPGLEPAGVPRELAGTAFPFRYNHFKEFEAALARLEGNLAAVVMEPMRSQWPQDDFVARVGEACRRRGGVFILDEITSGLRYGYPGAHNTLKIEPDIIAYAKAMSNGIPFGAIIGRDNVMTAAEKSFISSSYWTDGIGSAAALAVLDKVEKENVQERIWDFGKKFQTSLREIAQRHPEAGVTIGGMPSTPTLTFCSPALQKFFTQKMCERGFLVSSIFYLMHAHKSADLGALLDEMDSVFSLMESVNWEKNADNSLFSKTTGFERLA